jgi:hypothetical protein
VRTLRENEDKAAEREEAARAAVERDRAIWRGDLDDLKRTVEDCLERAIAAERETDDAKMQARAALQLCNETRTREAAAAKRADAAEARARLAEERYARLESFLSTSFSKIAHSRLRS